MTVGERIRQTIRDRGLTQTRVAEMMGVPVQNLNGMLTGQRALTIRHLATLEGLLGLGLNYGPLVEREEPCGEDRGVAGV